MTAIHTSRPKTAELRALITDIQMPLQTLISAKIAEFRARENHRGPFNEAQEISALSLAQVSSADTNSSGRLRSYNCTSVNVKLYLRPAVRLTVQLYN